MIVTSDNVENIDSKANLGQASASDIHPPPPPYTSTTAAESSSRSPPEHYSSQDLTYPYDVPPLLTQRPCNWLYAYNANSRIKDRYILDPSLKVPSSLMSEAAAEVQEAERDTLNLRSDTGSVDVVARIVDSSSGGANGAKKRRVRITLHSTHGSVTGRIVRQFHSLTLTSYPLTGISVVIRLRLSAFQIPPHSDVPHRRRLHSHSPFVPRPHIRVHDPWLHPILRRTHEKHYHIC